jgi:hypothetical protein
MNRVFFIITGVLVVAIVIAIWIYVLVFNTTPGTTPRFALFDFGDTSRNTDTSIPIEPDSTSITPTSTPSRKPLRQLTTRQVAGYADFIPNSATTPVVLIVERGTGHVYSIDTVTGTETRVSATTFANTMHASIFPNTGLAALQIGYGERSSLQLISVSTTSDQSTDIATIPNTGIDFTFSSTGDVLLYSSYVDSELRGFAYNVTTDTTRQIFVSPFREARVVWGNTAQSRHYLYPKAAKLLEGFVLVFENGSFSRVPADGFGLVADGRANTLIFSRQNNREFQSSIYHEGEVVSIPLMVFPEKCDFLADTTRFWCGHEIGIKPRDLPDAWYRGEAIFNDNLWLFDGITQSAIEIVDIESESGRNVDVTNLTVGTNGTSVYFQNRTDGSLWIYEDNQMDI